MTRRVAVIGDVGGHLEALRGELTRLGADPTTGTLPPGLTVIQVGDLVHRGPDSAGVVALVDRYLSRQPDQWVQLVGNHEAHYLRAPVFEWREDIGSAAAKTLRRWWAGGLLQAAAAIATDHESFLVTHAGLTVDFWRAVLGAPRDARLAAAAVNSLIGSHDDVLFGAGQMLGNRKRGRVVGPVWAAPAELLPGWVGVSLPFSQIHGHASVFDVQHRQFRVNKEVARRTTVDEDAKHEIVTLEGGRIIGIDPGHGRRAQTRWRAWQTDW